jgi:hypothetical protein
LSSQVAGVSVGLLAHIKLWTRLMIHQFNNSGCFNFVCLLDKTTFSPFLDYDWSKILDKVILRPSEKCNMIRYKLCSLGMEFNSKL